MIKNGRRASINLFIFWGDEKKTSLKRKWRISGTFNLLPVEDLGEMSSRKDNRTIEQTEGK